MTSEASLLRLGEYKWLYRQSVLGAEFDNFINEMMGG
jgi:hypothetical protein